MAPELSAELLDALRRLHGAEPLRVVDPQTNAAYVIVKAEAYDRLRLSLADEDPREAYPLIAAAMQEDDEHDPLLASYQSVARDATQQ